MIARRCSLKRLVRFPGGKVKSFAHFFAAMDRSVNFIGLGTQGRPRQADDSTRYRCALRKTIWMQTSFAVTPLNGGPPGCGSKWK